MNGGVFMNSRASVKGIEEILPRALDGERLSLEDGVALLETDELLPLAVAADAVRRRLHPEGRVTFVVDRNINYTNVCTAACRFCAFFRPEGHPEAYVLDREAVFAKIEETLTLGGTQILMQGGLHPSLGLDWACDLLRAIKSRYSIHIHSFSPPEIDYFARESGLPLRVVIERLREAGLDSIPGGGAEILDDRVRALISPRKIGWERWIEVMLTAHEVGMRTTATMMYGHVETIEERVRHILRIRDAQDKFGGFTAFIPWSFQAGNTALGRDGAVRQMATGLEYLKLVAVARLLLDNVANIQVSWVTQGAKLAQVALVFGANDFGSTMLEENVVRAAGVSHRAPMEEIIRCIREAGLGPAQRNTYYKVLREF